MFIYSDHHNTPSPFRENQLKKKELNTAPIPSSPESSKKSNTISVFLLALPILFIVIIMGLRWNVTELNAGFQIPPPTEIYRNEVPAKTIEADLDIVQPVVIAEHKLVIVPLRDTIVKGRPAEKNAGSNLKELVQLNASYSVKNRRVEDLVIRVKNQSGDKLDLVVVEVYYADKSGRHLRKETLYIKDVPAMKEAHVNASRGNTDERIIYKLSLVSAKDANLYLVAQGS